MTANIQIRPGYVNSFEAVIEVLRKDADRVDAAGLIAKASCYRAAANELEREFKRRLRRRESGSGHGSGYQKAVQNDG